MEQAIRQQLLHPASALLVADDSGRFCEVNDAAVSLLKYSKPELMQRHVWDITVGAQQKEARLLWNEFIKEGRQTGVYQVRRSDGRQVTVQYEATANIQPGRHISILLPVAGAQPESRPLDECPFERPFPVDFNRCPVYQPLLVHMADSREQPVAEVWTCEHLVASGIAGQHAFYGRCSLGDAMARSRWLAAAAQQGLTRVRSMRIAFFSHAESAIRELTSALAQARTAGRTPESLRRIRTAGERVLKAFDQFTAKNGKGLTDAGLDAATLHRALQETLVDAIQRGEQQALRPKQSLIAGYPRPVQAFLRPDLPAVEASRSRAR
jgi:PAS domain S-box-containing protein